jgi:hypothetical protein
VLIVGVGLNATVVMGQERVAPDPITRGNDMVPILRGQLPSPEVIWAWS